MTPQDFSPLAGFYTNLWKQVGAGMRTIMVCGNRGASYLTVAHPNHQGVPLPLASLESLIQSLEGVGGGQDHLFLLSGDGGQVRFTGEKLTKLVIALRYIRDFKGSAEHYGRVV